MKTVISAFGCSVVLAALFLTGLAQAANYHVPSGATPTLQDAVDDAAAGLDPQETIYLDADIDIFAAVEIGNDFDASHKLLICPNTTRLRSVIRMQACCEPAIHAAGAAYVTLQDLDIYRHITNNNHIIDYNLCSYMMIQRCRIGSDWTVPGALNWSAIHWVYPFNSVIRNTMTFATAPSTFQYGIEILSHDDPGSRLRLYNNSIQGFYGGGLAVSGTSGKIIIRNNVVVTEDAIAPDPVGYVGNLGAVNLVSSHNAVFCAAGDEWAGFDDIRGANFNRFNFADIAPSFISANWAFNVPNPNFLNLTGGGALHAAASFGINLFGAAPDPDDLAILDDWEKNLRPAGTPAHTDRGADQSDTDYAALDAAAPSPRAGIELSLGPLPSRGTLEAFIRAPTSSGEISLRLFDASGRFIEQLWSGYAAEGRRVRWQNRDLPAGVYFVRASNGAETISRRAVIVR